MLELYAWLFCVVAWPRIVRTLRLEVSSKVLLSLQGPTWPSAWRSRGLWSLSGVLPGGARGDRVCPRRSGSRAPAWASVFSSAVRMAVTAPEPERHAGEASFHSTA